MKRLLLIVSVIISLLFIDTVSARDVNVENFQQKKIFDSNSEGFFKYDNYLVSSDGNKLISINLKDATKIESEQKREKQRKNE